MIVAIITSINHWYQCGSPSDTLLGEQHFSLCMWAGSILKNVRSMYIYIQIRDPMYEDNSIYFTTIIRISNR